FDHPIALLPQSSLNPPPIPTPSKASCYISNFISDFINLDALSLHFEKVPWGAEKKQKDGSCFRIHSVSLCLIVCELSPLILREINVQGWNLPSSAFCKAGFVDSFNLVNLSIGESGVLKSPTISVWGLMFGVFLLVLSARLGLWIGWAFHEVPDFLDVLVYDLFGFDVFLD
ncbi:hypothetical protein STEG23_019398, partial [Scotinomys teguina]